VKWGLSGSSPPWNHFSGPTPGTPRGQRRAGCWKHQAPDSAPKEERRRYRQTGTAWRNHAQKEMRRRLNPGRSLRDPLNPPSAASRIYIHSNILARGEGRNAKPPAHRHHIAVRPPPRRPRGFAIDPNPAPSSRFSPSHPASLPGAQSARSSEGDARPRPVRRKPASRFLSQRGAKLVAHRLPQLRAATRGPQGQPAP